MNLNNNIYTNKEAIEDIKNWTLKEPKWINLNNKCLICRKEIMVYKNDFGNIKQKCECNK